MSLSTSAAILASHVCPSPSSPSQRHHHHRHFDDGRDASKHAFVAFQVFRGTPYLWLLHGEGPHGECGRTCGVVSQYVGGSSVSEFHRHHHWNLHAHSSSRDFVYSFCHPFPFECVRDVGTTASKTRFPTFVTLDQFLGLDLVMASFGCDRKGRGGE